MPHFSATQSTSAPHDPHLGDLAQYDLDAVTALLARLPGGWTADLNLAEPDASTIVVLPPDASDVLGPAFVLYRAKGETRGRFQLDQVRWEAYREIGSFASLDAALAEMLGHILALTGPRRH